MGNMGNMGGMFEKSVVRSKPLGFALYHHLPPPEQHGLDELDGPCAQGACPGHRGQVADKGLPPFCAEWPVSSRVASGQGPKPARHHNPEKGHTETIGK